jgi:50S ribosomal protein L16 3-hydroxylase
MPHPVVVSVRISTTMTFSCCRPRGAGAGVSASSAMAKARGCDHPDSAHPGRLQGTDEWVLEPGDMLYLPPRSPTSVPPRTNASPVRSASARHRTAEVLTHFTDFLAQFLPDEERYSDAGCEPCSEPAQITPDSIRRLQTLLTEQLSDERMLLTWFGQFMTEPRYPERVEGSAIEEDQLLATIADGALLVRNPSARLAWADVDTDVLLFASGHSRLLPGSLRGLLRLICSAESLHQDNLRPWLESSEGRRLLCELIKQGSLEFADE